MTKHLTDKTRKRIIADRAAGQTIRQLAAAYGVSTTTIMRTLKSDPTTVQIVAEKKAQNTADILDYMDTQKSQVCQLLDKYLTALLSDSKISQANVQQLATTLGIVVDKYTIGAKNDQSLKKLDELMGKIGGVI